MAYINAAWVSSGIHVPTCTFANPGALLLQVSISLSLSMEGDEVRPFPPHPFRFFFSGVFFASGWGWVWVFSDVWVWHRGYGHPACCRGGASYSPEKKIVSWACWEMLMGFTSTVSVGFISILSRGHWIELVCAVIPFLGGFVRIFPTLSTFPAGFSVRMRFWF